MNLEILPNDVDIKVLSVIRHITVHAQHLLTLPEIIQVEFRKLDGGVYAQSHISHRFKNRIVLNSLLNEQEIMLPFVHELIHVQQQHLGHLSCLASGTIVWKKQHFKNIQDLTYSEYQALPWECDAFAQQFPILKKCLEMSRHIPKI